MVSNIRPFDLERVLSRPILMTYPIPAEGIEWQTLQENIHTFLGPEAYARTHFGEGIKQYLITTTRPFTNSQLNDLRAFSAEMIENTEGFGSQWLDHPNSAQAYRGYYHSNHNNCDNPGDYNSYRKLGASIVQLQINFPIVQNPVAVPTTEPHYNLVITCHNCRELVPRES